MSGRVKAYTPAEMRRTVRSTLRLSVAVVAAVVLPAVSAYGQISPGDLSEAHSKLEGISRCTKCHDFERGLSRVKCLDCHSEIEARIYEKRGLHWRIELDAGKKEDCGGCHSEHNGRSFNLIYWGKTGIEDFDHDRSGFNLEGKHKSIDCRKCHRNKNIVKGLKEANRGKNAGKTFLGLGRACASCHADVHRSEFAGKCSDCLGTESWRPAPLFSHDRTEYALRGRHVKVDCEKCHKEMGKAAGKREGAKYVQFANLAHDDCSACHEDKHRTILGPRCDGCHDTARWEKVRDRQFDHGKTRFGLRGRHSSVSCEKCHLDATPLSSMKFERCVDCHRDIHTDGFTNAKYVGNCESCHREESFVPSEYGVKEHAESQFPLTGSHRAVQCILCHKRKQEEPYISFRIARKECRGCHEDRHKGQFAEERGYSGCENCHSTSRWDRLYFDHQKTSFPLDGRHSDVKCGKCHLPSERDSGESILVYYPLDKSCRGCHAENSLPIPAEMKQ